VLAPYRNSKKPNMNKDSNVQSVQDIDFPHQISHSIPDSRYKDLAMKKIDRILPPRENQHQAASSHQNHFNQLLSFKAYPTFLYIT